MNKTVWESTIKWFSTKKLIFNKIYTNIIRNTYILSLGKYEIEPLPLDVYIISWLITYRKWKTCTINKMFSSIIQLDIFNLQKVKIKNWFPCILYAQAKLNGLKYFTLMFNQVK